MNLTGNLNIRDSGSSIEGNGHNITAEELNIGSGTVVDVVVADVGVVTLNQLLIENGGTASIDGGVINNTFSLLGNSILTVYETNGTGLTLNGSLNIDGTSQMDLVFNGAGWAFRFQDASSNSNWISELESLIASNQISLSLPAGESYSVYDAGGYTYIGTTAVPEAGSITLASLAVMGIALRVVRQRYRNRSEDGGSSSTT